VLIRPVRPQICDVKLIWLPGFQILGHLLTELAFALLLVCGFASTLIGLHLGSRSSLASFSACSQRQVTTAKAVTTRTPRATTSPAEAGCRRDHLTRRSSAGVARGLNRFVALETAQVLG